MTEQQYRVIADRDNGDDPQWTDIVDGDRVLYVSGSKLAMARIDRIERPVPTTDEPATYEGATPRGFGITEFDFRSYEDAPEEVFSVQESSLAFERKVWIGVNRDRAHLNEDESRRVRDALNAFLGEPSPHPPTREQIADALFQVDYGPDASWARTPQAHHEFLVYADAVLALIENGADR